MFISNFLLMFLILAVLFPYKSHNDCCQSKYDEDENDYFYDGIEDCIETYKLNKNKPVKKKWWVIW